MIMIEFERNGKRLDVSVTNMSALEVIEELLEDSVAEVHQVEEVTVVEVGDTMREARIVAAGIAIDTMVVVAATVRKATIAFRIEILLRVVAEEALIGIDVAVGEAIGRKFDAVCNIDS